MPRIPFSHYIRLLLHSVFLRQIQDKTFPFPYLRYILASQSSATLYSILFMEITFYQKSHQEIPAKDPVRIFFFIFHKEKALNPHAKNSGHTYKGQHSNKMQIFFSLIQTILSAPESHRIMHQKNNHAILLRSRALPPVGTCTLP